MKSKKGYSSHVPGVRRVRSAAMTSVRVEGGIPNVTVPPFERK